MKKYIKSILMELTYASFFCLDTKEPIPIASYRDKANPMPTRPLMVPSLGDDITTLRDRSVLRVLSGSRH